MSPETGRKVHAIVTEGNGHGTIFRAAGSWSSAMPLVFPRLWLFLPLRGCARRNRCEEIMNRHFTSIITAVLAYLAVRDSTAADPQIPAAQLDPVVVTAARTPTPVKQIGSNVSVVTAEDIKMRQFFDVADMLRYVPGLDVIRNGDIGQSTSVFIRGADSRHTLVLIDGIEANDPADPGGRFDFANLMVDDIDRIEIVRGGESAVYGSDALGGVINIITKRGRGKPKATLMGEGGSYNTYKVIGGSDGGVGKLNYNISASQFGTQGFSAAARELDNFERDRYENTTVKAGVNGDLLENLNLAWTLHYNRGVDKLDNCGGRGCDDPNNHNTTNQLFTRGQGGLSLFDGRWQQALGVSYSLTGRKGLNPWDPLNPFVGASYFDGQKVKVNWLNDVVPLDDHKLTFGAEDEEDSIDSQSSFFQDPVLTEQPPINKSMNTAGVFLQHRWNVQEGWFSTAGVRYDRNDISGSKVTWRTSQSFAVESIGLRLKGNYGTGFKVPTLYQLYAPETVLTVQGQDPIIFPPLGNPDLRPESSRDWDIGFEQDLWDKRAQFGASYFHNDFFNLIEVRSFSSGYENIGRAQADGAEVFFQVQPHSMVSLRGQYTYMDTEQLPEASDPPGDIYAGNPLLRRPRNKGSFDVIVNPTDDSEVNVNVLAVGRKDDVDFAKFPAERVTLPGYVLVNLNARYTITQNLQVFGRLNNLLNKSYQEVFGYGTPGFSAFAGLQLSY
jgi:vitamin B12 transporter